MPTGPPLEPALVWTFTGSEVVVSEREAGLLSWGLRNVMTHCFDWVLSCWTAIMCRNKDDSFFFFFLTAVDSEEKEGTKGDYHSLARTQLYKLRQLPCCCFPHLFFWKEFFQYVKTRWLTPPKEKVAWRLNLLDFKRQSTRPEALSLISTPRSSPLCLSPLPARRVISSFLDHKGGWTRLSNRSYVLRSYKATYLLHLLGGNWNYFYRMSNIWIGS